MNRVYKWIRVLTVAPLLALFMIVILAICAEGVFPTTWHMIYSLFFLTVLPLLAYPMQRYIPGFREKGREGQRNLAILFAVVGFLLGGVVSFVLPSSPGLKAIYAEYVFSAVSIFVFNKVFHIRLSGHTCGALAPVALFFHFRLYAAAAVGIALAVFVFLASIKTQRHTVPQLLGGGLIPMVGIGMISLFIS